jgi:hypothetical protein
VLTNPEYLDTMTFLLKKYIKNAMKSISSPAVIQYLNRIFPTGRTAKDFLKSLFLLPMVNLIKVTMTAANEQITDTLKEYMVDTVLNLDKFVNSFLSTGFAGLSQILLGLKLSNVAIFDVLSMLNKKIISTTPTTQVPESYRFNMRHYKPIV